MLILIIFLIRDIYQGRLYSYAMNILAIETSSPQGTLALQVQDAVYQVELPEQRQQIAQILPTIDRLLNAHSLVIADLDLLAFSAGPGSFTGVRVALGIIQGLSLALQLPVVPLSSLEILASTARRLCQYEKILCCINAYMQEVYVAAYEIDAHGHLEMTFSERIISATEISTLSFADYHLVGDAWQTYSAVDKIEGLTVDKTILFPEARDILGLAENAAQQGNTMAIEMVSPRYLRGKSAWQKTS